jgi:hypothetical protein
VVGGTGATGDAFLFNGVVMYIGITTEGTGYTNPPSIFRFLSLRPISLPLAITNIGGTLTLAWPTNLMGFKLQSITNLASPVWGTNLPTPVVVNGQNTATNSISSTQQFYRLSQ